MIWIGWHKLALDMDKIKDMQKLQIVEWIFIK